MRVIGVQAQCGQLLADRFAKTFGKPHEGAAEGEVGGGEVGIEAHRLARIPLGFLRDVGIGIESTGLTE